jgi:3-oxoacyl-[acyl-carrier protein] reductase
MKLRGKRAIITGGASGIGLAVAARFAREGADLAILDLSGEGARRAAAELAEFDVSVVGYEVDVSNRDQAEPAIADIVADLGGVEILVNAASPSTAYAEGDDWHRWRYGIDRTLSSVYLMTSLVVPHIERSGGGSLLHIASTAAFGASGRTSWYGVAKAAVVALTRAHATQYAPMNIRANAICPGIIVTPRTSTMRSEPDMVRRWIEGTPLGRFGRVEEVVEPALFLCCDEMSSFITGVALPVDGGHTAANGMYRNPDAAASEAQLATS